MYLGLGAVFGHEGHGVRSAEAAPMDADRRRAKEERGRKGRKTHTQGAEAADQHVGSGCWPRLADGENRQREASGLLLL